MKINVIYTDYKNQKIYKYFLNCSFKEDKEIKLFNNLLLDKHKEKEMCKVTTVDTNIIDYVDEDGNEYYGFNLLSDMYENYKSSSQKKFLAVICDALFIAVPKNNNTVLKVLLDKKVLDANHRITDKFSDVYINLNIHDKKGVFNLINTHNKTKIE
jgi:hypothetical protein